MGIHGRKCLYENCGHYQNIHKCKYRSFPQSAVLSRVWLDRCGITTVTPKRITPHMFVCSCHFPNGKDAEKNALPNMYVELYDDDNEVEHVHQDVDIEVIEHGNVLPTNHISSLDHNVSNSLSPNKRSIGDSSISVHEQEAGEPLRKRTMEEVTPSTRLAIAGLLSLPVQQHQQEYGTLTVPVVQPMQVNNQGEDTNIFSTDQIGIVEQLDIHQTAEIISMPIEIKLANVQSNAGNVDNSQDHRSIDWENSLHERSNFGNFDFSVQTSPIDLENSAETTKVMDRTKTTPSGKRLSFTPKSKLWKLLEASATKKRKLQRRQLLVSYSKAHADSETTPPMSKNPSFEIASAVNGVKNQLPRQSTMNSFGEEPKNFFVKQTSGSANEPGHISTEEATQVNGGVTSVRCAVCGVRTESNENEKEKDKLGSRRPQKSFSLCINLSYAKCRLMPEAEFQFFTGVTQSVFEIVYEVLLGGDEVCNNLKYQYGRKTPSTRTKNVDEEEVQLKSKDKLLFTLLRLRRGYPLRDLGMLFSISEGWASKIFYTWVRFMGLQFSRLDKYLFVSSEVQEKNKPKCFEPFKNLRVIIDATEMRIQRPGHLQHQSNTYSDYKSGNTVKFLVGISCYGGLSFLSEAYEGSISDRKLLQKSGLLDYLVEGDSVMADRGFDVEDLLNELGVDLIIPAFLGKRDAFTAREVVGSKMIASARIHVENFIGRVKQFRLMRFPLSSNYLLPYVSDVAKICAYLVNFNSPHIDFDH